MAEYYGIHYDSVIEHHGIKGQKWGVRRYQNPDGTLTPLGRKKLGRLEQRASEVKTSMEKAKARYTALTAKKKSGKATTAELKELKNITSSLKKTSKKLTNLERKKSKLSGPDVKEKTLDEVVRSGTKEEIIKRSSEMTVSQLQEAFQRLNTKAQISKLDSGTKGMGEKFVDNLSKTANTVSSIYDSVQKITKVTNAIGLTDIKLGQPKKPESEVSKFVQTATAEMLLKKKDKLTTEQKKQAVERLKAEEDIKSYIDKKTKAQSDAAKAKKEAEINSFINNASATQLWEARNRFTNEQRHQAVTKLRAEETLKEYAKKQREAEEEEARKQQILNEHIKNLLDNLGNYPAMIAMDDNNKKKR